MTIRLAKILILAALALDYSLVVFNNLDDFNTNFQFVRHVLLMDTTAAGNHPMGRAIHSPALHLAFYVGIIAWEVCLALLAWWGAARMLWARAGTAKQFNAAKQAAIAALTASLLLWLVAFFAVGGEWFLMWQSAAWNGQQAAFRNFTMAGIVLLFLIEPETDAQS